MYEKWKPFDYISYLIIVFFLLMIISLYERCIIRFPQINYMSLDQYFQLVDGDWLQLS